MAPENKRQNEQKRAVDPAARTQPRREQTAPPQQYFRSALPSFNQPYWVKQARRTPYPMLAGKLAVDVVVVGAGITGLTTAMLLREAGKRVAVVDMNVVGGGTTGHSTGHLDNHYDETLRSVLSKFGQNKGSQILRAKRSAIDLIEQWDTKYRLESRFKRIPGYLYTEHQSDIKSLEEEFEAARKFGLEAEFVDAVSLPFPVKRAVRFPNQGRFSPLKYVQSLARAFVDAGGQVFENTRAEEIEKENGNGIVHTNHGDIVAEAVVLAGHAPLLGTFSLQIRNYPYQSYVLGVRVKDEITDALYWDTMEPYHYSRRATSDDPKLLIIGGADHHTGTKSNTHRAFKELERYVRQRYQVESIEYRWSHEYFEPADSVPYIGVVPGYGNIYVGTGYAGDGLTFGTVAGMVMRDLILGRETELAKILSPSRIKPIASAPRITSGVVHMAQHFVGDRIGSGDVESVDKITRGHGGIVVVNGERLAVYRDEQDGLHVLSPVCRHMGCIVHWNQAERTWDCPCHGGRYDAYGRVIMGPPMSSLPHKQLPSAHSRK